MARVSLLTALAVAAACQYVSAGTTFKQAAQAAQPKKILHFSDVHLRLSESLDATESANIPIQYGQDAPIALLTSALQFAKTVLPDPDLFLYTGDHVVHGDLEDEFVAATVETNVKTLEEYYPPGNTTLDTTAIIGNADTPGDYRMEVTDGTKENPAIALIADAWSNSLSAADLDTFKRQGFLSYNLDDNLVVLSLNTLPYSPNHLPNTVDQPDPFGQFAWLNSTLRTIKQQKKVAYIVGHIPPMVDSYRGAPLWHPSYIATYKQIVGQFASVVKAQFFAHVHSVEVRVPVKGAGGFDSVPLFTTAAISPLYKNNPAFVVWDFHPTTYDLLDFTVYGSNITDSSAVAGWKQLFKATEAFKVKSLSTSEFRKFVNRATADSALLQQYYNNAKALSYKWPTCADTACRAKWRCSLSWWSTAAEYEDCVAAEEDPKTVAAATTLSANSSGSSGWGPSQALIAVGAVAVAAIAVVFVVGRRHRKKKQQRQQQQQHHASATTPDSGSSADSFLVLAQTPL